MSSGVINKYLIKKKKDLIDYARVLETIITIDANSMWKTKKEFIDFASPVIDYYVDNFYFENNSHRDNPVEYSNDNINLVLKSIIEYCKKTNQVNLLQEKKNETFVIAVIVCTACYLDISCNVVDGNFIDTKGKFKYLLQYLEKTNILKVNSKNKKVINTLFSKVKDNLNKEEKFFKLFINKNNCNIYNLFTEEPQYYLVNHVHKIDGLEEYDSKMVESINKDFIDKYLNISYELLTIELLKEFISNRKVNSYLVPVTESILKKKSSFRLFDDKLLSEHIKVLIDYDLKDKYSSYVDNLKNIGLQVVYEYSGDDEVSSNTFIRNMEVIVSSKFLKANEEKIYSWNSQGIKFIVKNTKEDVE